MNKYDNSTPFDSNLWSTAPEVDFAIKDLKEKICASGTIQRWHKRYDDNLRLILLNLFRAANWDPEKYVAYSRKKETYQTLKFYKNPLLKYDAIVKLVDILANELGYIETKLGFSFREQGYFRTARMKATPEFIEMMKNEYDLSEFSPSRFPGERNIILRDKVDGKKVLVEYTPTPQTELMEKNLQQINTVLSQHHVGLCVADSSTSRDKGRSNQVVQTDYKNDLQMLRLSLEMQGDGHLLDEAIHEMKTSIVLEEDPQHGDQIVFDEEMGGNFLEINRRHEGSAPSDIYSATDFTRTVLSRVFNDGRFDHGGRFYRGWWQSIPSKFRKFIRIDDEPVVEIDFSGLHFCLLYLESDLPIPAGDVYAVDGLPAKARPYLKRALNIVLNSDDESSAIGAIQANCYLEKLRVAELAKYSDKQIIDMLLDKHSVLRDQGYFYSGYGVKLQYIDSMLAEAIMLDLANQDIPALPVHDSFLVAKKHRNALYQAMMNATRQRYSVEMKTKLSTTAYEESLLVLRENISEEDLPNSEEEFEHSWINQEACKRYYSRFNAWRRRNINPT
ncbi:hypothetical protein [uncultured Desulfuromonas sp.]|uniref:hypothetical protein n=1 Tax=uncultured Desulfuromonas sp. TaxID=181013 RepID=UPI002AAAD803|nr:hypothetical protein [uncultured Desulfuromonas sp.]